MRKCCESCLKLIAQLFLGLMILIAIAVLLWDRFHEIPFPNQCRQENIVYFVLAGFLISTLLLISKWSRIRVSDRIYHGALGIFGSIGGGYQLLVSGRANLPSGDFAEVMQAAISLAQGESFTGTFYFVRYPNNANLAIFLSFVYRILGDWRSIVFLGALLTTLSAILVSLTVRNLTEDYSSALFAFLCAEVLQALTWRAFLVYTDNFGMIFVAGLLYLFSTKLPYRWKLPLLCLMAAFGCFIKVTVAIVMAGIVLGFLLKSGRKKMNLQDWRKILYGAVCLAVSVLFLVTVQNHLYKKYQLETADKLYVTGWQYMFMLGQNTDSYGTYNNLDAGEIFHQMNHQAEEEGLGISYVNEEFQKEALQRIQDRGLLGNLSFYLGKLDVAYCDGYFNNVQAGLDGERQETKKDLLFAVLDPSGEYYGTGVVLLQVLWDSVLLLIVLGAFFTGGKRGAESCFKIMILGITLYLLIFENRSKYLYMFLPVYISMAGMGLHRLKLL